MAHSAVSQIMEWPVMERLKAVEAIWESIVAEGEGPDLTEAQRRTLDERLEEYQQDAHPGDAWQEVKERVRLKR